MQETRLAAGSGESRRNYALPAPSEAPPRAPAPAAAGASPRPPFAPCARTSPATHTAQAFRAPLRRKKRVSQHPAAHIAGPLARTTRQEVRRARGPGRSIVAVGAGRPLRSFRSPPAGRFGPSAQVPTGHALPSGALRAAFRIPGAFPKASIWRRHPALARDRLPASSGRPASLSGAVDSEALRSKVSLRVSPAASKTQGKRVLSEKIAKGELFRQAFMPAPGRQYPSAIPRWRLRPMYHLLSYNNLPICQ